MSFRAFDPLRPFSRPRISGGEEEDPLFLDTYPAAAAWSVRLLRTAYAGPCLRVRRSSDNAEADIGFADGWLDEAALLAHCGAGSGYVKTWYDQSTDAYHAIEVDTANQPRIVNAGAVETLNGKPCLKGISGSFEMAWGSSLTFDSIAAVWAMSGGSWDYLLSAGGDQALRGYGNRYRTSENPNFFTNTTATVEVNGADVSNLFIVAMGTSQHVIVATETSYAHAFDRIGSAFLGRSVQGKMQEIVGFLTDNSANHAGIAANQNAAFTVF